MTKNTTKKTKKNKNAKPSLWRGIKKIILYFIALSVFWVVFYRFVNPPTTWLILTKGGSKNVPKNIPERKWMFGMESACKFYYQKSATSLSKRQAALLIAVLPNPIRWKPNAPTPFINRKVNTIVRYMGASKIP